jgi:hypothetical protein
MSEANAASLSINLKSESELHSIIVWSDCHRSLPIGHSRCLSFSGRHLNFPMRIFIESIKKFLEWKKKVSSNVLWKWPQIMIFFSSVATGWLHKFFLSLHLGGQREIFPCMPFILIWMLRLNVHITLVELHIIKHLPHLSLARHTKHFGSGRDANKHNNENGLFIGHWAHTFSLWWILIAFLLVCSKNSDFVSFPYLLV